SSPFYQCTPIRSFASHHRAPSTTYLSPSFQKTSKVTKAKAHSVSKDLFSVLRTPDMKRRMEIIGQLDSLTTKRPSSILKHTSIVPPSESSNDSTVSGNKTPASEGQRLKVSFSIDKTPKPAAGNQVEVEQPAEV